MTVIKSIEIISWAKIHALFGIVFGLVYGIFFAIMGAAIGANRQPAGRNDPRAAFHHRISHHFRDPGLHLRRDPGLPV